MNNLRSHSNGVVFHGRWLLAVAAVLLPLLLVIGFVQAASQAGQALDLPYRLMIGYDYDQAGERERIVMVDPHIGGNTPITTLNLGWAGVDQFAFDASTGTAYLGGRAPGESAWRLYVANIYTGAVVSSTLLDTGLGGFGFALSGPGALAAYEIVDKGDVDGYRCSGRIVLLDPLTGAKTPVALLQLDWLRVGAFTVDPANQVAYLAGRRDAEAFWRLFRVNLASGVVSDTVVLDTGDGGFGFTAYTPGQLLAYMYEGGQGLIVSLDPASGVTTTLASFAMDFSGIGQFVADTDNQLAYLGAMAPGEDMWRMYIADLSSGSVYTHTLLDTGDGGFGFNAYLQAWYTFLPAISR